MAGFLPMAIYCNVVLVPTYIYTLAMLFMKLLTCSWCTPFAVWNAKLCSSESVHDV